MYPPIARNRVWNNARKCSEALSCSCVRYHLNSDLERVRGVVQCDFGACNRRKKNGSNKDVGKCRSRLRASVLVETAEQCRYYPGSHADLAGFEGETERNVVDVGCCKLIGKEGEGVYNCCLLFLKERASL